MLTFTKDILRHSCNWTTPEEASRQITGFPDTLLNVNEGYEVLHFVCRYMACKGWGAESTFQDLESFIKTRLPFAVRTHAQVRDWLDLNYRR